jgi:copper chaperone CopZ
MNKSVRFLTMACILAASVMFTSYAVAQENPLKKGEKEVQIATSAQCGMCKATIEKELAFTKGVTFVDLNVDTKVATVRYKEQKTNVAAIRKAIAGAGYDADEVPAVEKAYDKLPACCKKGGHDNDHGHH